MDATLTLLEAARIVGIGLNLGLFDSNEVVAWADGQIAAESDPPFWLLELATTHQLLPYDTPKLALANLPEISSDLACGVLLGLLLAIETVPTERLPDAARFVYRIVREVCKADWRNRILYEADRVKDDFVLIRDGILDATVESGRQEMAAFLAKYDLREKAKVLKPIRILFPF